MTSAKTNQVSGLTVGVKSLIDVWWCMPCGFCMNHIICVTLMLCDAYLFFLYCHEMYATHACISITLFLRMNWNVTYEMYCLTCKVCDELWDVCHAYMLHTWIMSWMKRENKWNKYYVVNVNHGTSCMYICLMHRDTLSLCYDITDTYVWYLCSPWNHVGLLFFVASGDV